MMVAGFGEAVTAVGTSNAISRPQRERFNMAPAIAAQYTLNLARNCHGVLQAGNLSANHAANLLTLSRYNFRLARHPIAIARTCCPESLGSR